MGEATWLFYFFFFLRGRTIQTPYLLASIFLLYVRIILLCCRYSILYYYALSFHVSCCLFFKKEEKEQFKLLIFWLIYFLVVVCSILLCCRYSILYYTIMHYPFGLHVVSSYFSKKKKIKKFKLLIFWLVFSYCMYVLFFCAVGIVYYTIIWIVRVSCCQHSYFSKKEEPLKLLIF